MAKEMRKIWLIDDQMSLLQGREKLQLGKELTVTEPEGEAFEKELSGNWDLILVDEQLWGDDRLPPSAIDGSSLVACMRAWARREARELPGVVILTAEADVFKNEVPAVGAFRPVFESFIGHEALIGPTLGVDWLLEKSDPALPAKVSDLCNSLILARKCFGRGGISSLELETYLAMPKQSPWHSHAAETLRESRAPVTEDAPNDPHPPRGPVTAINWLLRRALSFPGLFISDNFAAVTLGVKPDRLDKAIKSRRKLSVQLKQSLYRGPLKTLVSRRWWAPGVDYVALEFRRSSKIDPALLGLEQDDLLGDPDSVVAIDRTLKESRITNLKDTVRVNPPGWPPEAFQPWMLLSEAKATTWARAMVDPADTEVLSD